MPRKTDLSELMGELKCETSKWMKSDGKTDDFYWQKGYGVFSIGQSQMETVVRYIKRQKEHHQK